MTIYMDTYEYFIRTGIHIMTDAEYLVVEHHNTNTGEITYSFHSPETGIGGNMNNSIKRYHGWRGTTNGIETTAIGIRKVKKLWAFQNGRNRITLSDDLHPEWE